MADNSRGVRSMADPLVEKGIQELIEVIFFRKIGKSLLIVLPVRWKI